MLVQVRGIGEDEDRLGYLGLALGAVVEVECEDAGRTFFLAPVGAGIELTGPGGDGFLSVVTPTSPFGRAVMGTRVGDTVEVVAGGRARAWTVSWVG
jgi:transcription elongation GreA/GreB family factor